MKTYYIVLEGQAGFVENVYEVIADNEDEAYEKVKDYVFNQYSSYTVSKKEALQIQDEIAEDMIELPYYDEKHATEWMERHPHGWYNNENDYGEDVEERNEEE